MLNLEPGRQPWQVGDVFRVHNKFNHPTAGIMRIGDDVVAFRCIAGHGEEKSLWVFAQRPHYIEAADLTTPTDLFQHWAIQAGGVTVALASDAKGIIDQRYVKIGTGTPYSSYAELASDALGLSSQTREAIGIC
ncbi:MAG: hypothetical protein WCF24_11425 [Acidimicrobiales bacterium]